MCIREGKHSCMNQGGEFWDKKWGARPQPTVFFWYWPLYKLVEYCIFSHVHHKFCNNICGYYQVEKQCKTHTLHASVDTKILWELWGSGATSLFCLNATLMGASGIFMIKNSKYQEMEEPLCTAFILEHSWWLGCRYPCMLKVSECLLAPLKTCLLMHL